MRLSRSEKWIAVGVISIHLFFILWSLIKFTPQEDKRDSVMQANLISAPETAPQPKPEPPKPKPTPPEKNKKPTPPEPALKTLATETPTKTNPEKPTQGSGQTQASTNAPTNPGVQGPTNVDINQLIILYKPDTEVFYPSFSKRIGEEGNVEMRIQIDESGNVQNVQVVTSSGSPRLDKAASELAARVRFKPHTQNGTPIKVTAKIGVRFKLKD
jgi:protein TonB